MSFMSLAAGSTDDRALLCSLTISSMNFLDAPDAETEHMAEFSMIQPQSNTAAAVLLMPLWIKPPQTKAPKLKQVM